MYREPKSDPKPEKVEKPKYRKIRRVSKKLSREQQVYRKARKIHLEENPFCVRCGFPGDQIHHAKGRIGSLLNDMRYFKTVCPTCHQWIEEHPHEAILKGYSFYRNHDDD